MKIYAHGTKKLRQMERNSKAALQAFAGKLAIAATYEDMGKKIPEKLKERIQDKRIQLQNRGAI